MQDSTGQGRRTVRVWVSTTMNITRCCSLFGATEVLPLHSLHTPIPTYTHVTHHTLAFDNSYYLSRTFVIF